MSYLFSIICRNGHLITGSSEGDNSDNKHCRECGAETITKCEMCNTSIRGRFDERNSYLISFEPYTYVPAHCHQCGAAYPWTQQLVERIKYLIGLDNNLTITERAELIETTKRITVESCTSSVDASIFKKLTEKTSDFLKDALYAFAVDVASETVRKILFPSH